jgi:general secretion pathway protein B
MSILLEALRKTEKIQQPRSVPSIHSDDPSERVSEPIRPLPLVLLLAVTLVLTGWFVWRQYQAPAGSDLPDTTTVAGAEIPDQKPEVIEKPVAQALPADKPVQTPAGGQRTPVESYQPPADETLQAEEESPDAAGAGAGPEGERGFGLKSRTASATAGDPAETQAKKDSGPAKPQAISYWELPDSIRTDVPEFKFSVLVYSVLPADRFVLINGQRLREGDSVQPGVVVEEIRLDGVIFSYRLYRFLVER